VGDLEKMAFWDLLIVAAKSELFIPVDPQHNSPRYPDLTFVPIILRPFSIIFLIFLFLLMIVALMFCAIYSSTHGGLVAYAGGLTGGQYFLFQFVPQILAAILLLYLEGVITAVTRIVPFTMMASDNSLRRSNALFVDLYSKGLFWPRFDYLSSGETVLGICSLMLWPIIFTIPLQSSLFSVIIVNGVWRWTAVRGVVWTLIAIYILAMIALVMIGFYFFRRATGLIWDPRSLADIIALLPRSNSLEEYLGTEALASKRELRTRLAVSSERLGYWRTNNALQEIFYCIGEEGAPTRRYIIQDGKAEKTLQIPVNDKRRLIDVEGRSSYQLAQPEMRFRQIPWYLSDAMVLLWPIAGFFLLLALFIVSFLPSTALKNGFLPLVPAAPDSAGFSAANFLYSFVPSMLGLLVYFGFRSLSLKLYQLAPWATLSNPNGAIASESILLDYTASIPLLPALTNGHGLIAFISVIAPLTILLPILAGGLFFPIQFVPSNVVMMLPNLPSYYIILIVLIFAEISLVTVAVSLLGTGKRKRYHLPHAVSCLAEIISFVYASDMVHDAAFRAVRGKADLRARLIGRRERAGGAFGAEEVRYGFGVFKSRDGGNHLGINMMRRMKRREWLSTGGRDFEVSRSRFSN
jgi:hypothetical protein